MAENFEKKKTPEETVLQLAGMGMTQDMIAEYMEMSDNTLRKRYAKELKRGKAVAASHVINSAFQMARGLKHPTMTMFWLKTQLRWRETDKADDTPHGPEQERVQIFLPDNGREPLSRPAVKLDENDEAESVATEPAAPNESESVSETTQDEGESQG